MISTPSLPRVAAVASRQRPGLLSMESSASDTRPLLAWSLAERAALADVIGAMKRTWLGEWSPGHGMEGDGGNGEQTRIDSMDAMDPQEASHLQRAEWRCVVPHRAGMWWSLLPAATEVSTEPRMSSSGRKPAMAFNPRNVLLDAFFHEPTAMLAGSDDRIADHLVDAAWLAWCDSLTGLCAELDLPHTGVPHGLPGELSRAWQGALRVRLPWFGATLSLVLSGDVVAAWVRQWRSRAMAVASSSPVPAQSSPLTPVVQAVSGRTVPLTVELAQVEIEIGALMTLRVGDVLRTTHALETPLLVRGEASAQDGGSPVFSEGFLGRLGERRAVELSKESSRD